MLVAMDVTGPDAPTFLQGQLTQDVEALEPDAPAYAAWVNPGGRVIAVLDIAIIDGGWRLFAPVDLGAALEARLMKFRLRSQVQIVRHGGAMAGAFTPGSEPAPATGGSDIVCRMLASSVPVTEWYYTGSAAPTPPSPALETDAWLAARIQAGVAWIDSESSEKYTAHQLNLDLVGALSLTKGCYSGQEIVARTHNLGRVKRRARRFIAAGVDAQRAAGTKVYCGDASVGSVVASAHANGRTEFLVLMQVSAPPAPLLLDDGTALEPAPIPYSLPPP